jgi:hypothetical protein
MVQLKNLLGTIGTLYIKEMETQIVKLLSDLAAFNKLDLMTVNLISGAFDIDAISICKMNGIIYTIPSN